MWDLEPLVWKISKQEDIPYHLGKISVFPRRFNHRYARQIKLSKLDDLYNVGYPID